ncbi:MAG TPA: DUF5668 domain-containing protein [Chloroflexota bacterium]
MATQPPVEPPPASTPPPPGPGASRQEWHAYRHQMRDYWRSQGNRGWYGPGRGSLALAIALIILGGYFLLRNLGLLNWLRDDVFWPLVLIALGLLLLFRRGNWWRT